MASLTPDLPAVAERVERLERELRAERRRNRWLRATVALATVAAIQAGIWPDTTATAQTQGPKGIRANQFVLDDEMGKARASLTVGNGEVGLALNDKHGESRLMLGLSRCGPALSLYDETGRTIWAKS